MARLAAAQIEPHFCFNTLASVQHWVPTQDERAAPLLAALTGYLRATLPLFDHPLAILLAGAPQRHRQPRHIGAAVRVDEGHMHLTLRGRPETLPVSRHFQPLFKGQ